MTRRERLELLQYTSRTFSIKTVQVSQNHFVFEVYNQWEEQIATYQAWDDSNKLSLLDSQFESLKTKYILDHDGVLAEPIAISIKK